LTAMQCFEHTRRNGQVLEICAYPIDGDRGFITVYTDVTERRRAEALLRTSRDQLETRVEIRSARLKSLNDRLALEINSRRRTSAALRESSNWIRLIADAVPALIAYVGADRRYRFVNRQYETWFGVSVNNVIGQTYGIFIDPAYHPRLDAAVRSVLSGKSSSGDYELKAADGRTLNVRSSLIPHFGDDGTVQGFVVLVQDLTEHLRAQAALNQAQKMEVVGQLTGGIAHDFNNLLTIIMGNLALLEEELTDAADLQEAARTAMNAARRGAELTGRLLAFSRRQALRPRVIAPAQLLATVDDFLRRILGETIVIENKVDRDIWNILADQNQLTNALLNLAINARDAMPHGGTLTIAAANVTLEDADIGHPDTTPGDYVLLSVTDTGVGMAPEVMERAFEPFFTTKHFGAGSGLGLSMVYGFARQSGGHISIHSRPGRGTTVELYLPRIRQSDAAEDAPRDEPCRRGDETVLLVEDDPDVRRFVRRTLEELGYTVREAADGQSALALLAGGGPVDLLLTDLVMPGGLSGYDLAREAATRQPGIRVLYMSGYPDQAAARRIAAGGEPALLSKPFQKQDLARAVRAVLDRATPPPPLHLP
nr:response regulator [Pseudomonadota bacterium]